MQLEPMYSEDLNMKELEAPSYMDNYNTWGNIPDINGHGGFASYDNNQVGRDYID